MDELELKGIINGYMKEICHFSQMQVFATSYYQKSFFQQQLDEKINSMMDIILQYSEGNLKKEKVHAQQQDGTRFRQFSLQELSYFDGANGKEAYVAVNGIVYNMTMIPGWAGGTHFGLYAGKNLNDQFMSCHNQMLGMLDQIPKVGVLNL